MISDKFFFMVGVCTVCTWIGVGVVELQALGVFGSRASLRRVYCRYSTDLGILLGTIFERQKKGLGISSKP
ncbi:MAG: hypothetical protein P4L55_24320 [Syntrophobacteraceae bacterium]|nr:hypothetical protein [Syntrophobacteraceae bacterium]